MQNAEDKTKASDQEDNNSNAKGRKEQQQSDPQMTELKGFFDKNEKLEPELEDENEQDQK